MTQIGTAAIPSGAGWSWKKCRRPLLQLTCLLVGAMMFYRGLLNFFGYPSEWISLFPGVPLLGDICRIPSYWERWALGPIFLGGTFGIVLMWRELKLGWWVFTALNFLVGYWFIFILEDIWQHHVAPHIVFSAVFLPFYPGMKKSGLLGWLGNKAMDLLNRKWLADLIVAVPPLHRWINKIVINKIVGLSRYRPHPFSTMSPYSSWSSLTDRTWAGRHLGVSEIDQVSLPDPEKLKAVFKRPDGAQRMCPKSTCLFPTFAQYLTDGFLRTVPEKHPQTGIGDENNRKRNNSNHEIDMCTLYGRTPEQVRALREDKPGKERRGHLRSQIIDGEEYPPFLFRDGKIAPEFECLDWPLGLVTLLEACEDENPLIAAGAVKMRDALFAVGGDRVNSVPQVSMLNTIWLREHNRLARELGRQHADWDDERVFQTARNIVIVEFIKIVVEEYINHIAPIAMPLLANPKVCWNAPWNRPNWITTEFSLLYRWHALIPDRITWGGQALPVDKTYLLNNLPLLKVGVKRGFEDMSAQVAAELGPHNTTEALLDIEKDSIRQGRICQLASYNDYREYLGRERAKTFAEISSDPSVQQFLEEAYDKVDFVDFFVGIFCEDRVKASPLPQTILSFMAIDAFSQALPNPLLSQHVFEPEAFKNGEIDEHPTFTTWGFEQISTCTSLRVIVARNVEEPETLGRVAMTQADWQGE